MRIKLREILDVFSSLPEVGLALSMLTRSMAEDFANLFLFVNLRGGELSAFIAGPLAEEARNFNVAKRLLKKSENKDAAKRRRPQRPWR
ncbi:hypothetical protein JW916_07350 [Candidatus Sumerlaeota bacterium]|nr:hypothetical protein [Candidatus Sumerlaeota bacterium]